MPPVQSIATRAISLPVQTKAVIQAVGAGFTMQRAHKLTGSLGGARSVHMRIADLLVRAPARHPRTALHRVMASTSTGTGLRARPAGAQADQHGRPRRRDDLPPPRQGRRRAAGWRGPLLQPVGVGRAVVPARRPAAQHIHGQQAEPRGPATARQRPRPDPPRRPKPFRRTHEWALAEGGEQSLECTSAQKAAAAQILAVPEEWDGKLLWPRLWEPPAAPPDGSADLGTPRADSAGASNSAASGSSGPSAAGGRMKRARKMFEQDEVNKAAAAAAAAALEELSTRLVAVRCQPAHPTQHSPHPPPPTAPHTRSPCAAGIPRPGRQQADLPDPRWKQPPALPQASGGPAGDGAYPTQTSSTHPPKPRTPKHPQPPHP